MRYAITDGDVRLLPLKPVSRLFGVLRVQGPALTVEEMEKAVSDGAADE